MADTSSLPPGWDCHVHVFDGKAPSAGAHYHPLPRPLPEIEAIARAQGCGHLVLVQPSVYGTDNALMLQALRAAGGRHRGIVVLHGAETEAELDAMHAAGVRGIRFNLVSPVGSAMGSVAMQLERLAPALHERGWHVQWYARPADLRQLAAWQRGFRLTFVLDHLAGLTPAHADDPGAWDPLRELAEAGSWIKLSGWYRLQMAPPYDAVKPLVRRVAELFPGRMVWGSDWPHTSMSPEALPGYATVWQPVLQSLGEETAQRVREAGAILYCMRGES
ncbi:amidohydrolase family protein [Ramlibacter sp. AW1]|uniref:Amidohydrolase family protein n=1 Tax=Ramlibacter aurantiacus TaxID=2801330 RepID=A0A936ZFR8_9BURK|nr:amidohydrolase family protein [Ramlibacter aurantiacus]MBL0420684.1 amidohydrolase family protein [Ramlibacter aurantiacus]